MSWFSFRKKSQDSKMNGKKQKNDNEEQKITELSENPESIEKVETRIERFNKYLDQREKEMEEEEKQFEETQQKLNSIFDRTEEGITKLTVALNKQDVIRRGNTKPYYTINYNSQTKDAGPDEFKGIPRQIDEPEVKSLNS